MLINESSAAVADKLVKLSNPVITPFIDTRE